MSLAHFNHAGTSWPKPRPVQEAVARALASNPMDWASSFARQHRRVADGLGVGDPTRVLLTPGATSALSLAIQDLPWSPGERVITSGFEHHALMRPLLQLTQRGVELEVVPPDRNAPVDLDRFDAALAKGARLVAMSAASNITGTRLPIDAIVERSHAAGALVLVDAAQEAGWVPLRAEERNLDLVAFAGHKGPQAPWGIGGLYVAPHVQMMSPLATCEVGVPCAPMPGYCDGGSVDRAALAGLCAGLDWLDARPDRLARAQSQIACMQAALGDAFTVHGTADTSARMPTLALTHTTRSPAELADSLRQRGVQAAAGLMCAPEAHRTLGTQPDGVLRLSVGPATRDEDVDAAIAALSASR
ncbi:MAG: aminotransferase class V-fold PLP-dependent enzyme [Sandaracinaceae bacterium]